MSRVLSRKTLCIIIIVCVLPFVMEVLLTQVIQKGIVPGIRIHAEGFTDGAHTFAPRFLEPGDPVQGRYTVAITGDYLRRTGGPEPALLVSRMNGEGYRVYLNGTLIGSAGDPEDGRANIWNIAMVFPIDTALVQDWNEIVFEIHHQYNAGLNGMILLTGIDRARGVLGIIINASDAWSYISIGLLFAGCVGLLLMIMLNPRRHHPHIFMLLSMMAMAVYALDYIFIPYLPFPHIVFKKITAGAMFISMACLSAALSMLFHKKLPVIVGVIQLAGIMSAILLIDDIAVFARVYALCSISVPIAAAVWFLCIIPCCKIKEETWIFAMGLGLFAIESAYNVIMLYCCPGLLLGTVFPFAFIYLSAMILLMHLDIRRKNETIQQESSRRFHFYRKSITDSLTGLFNREHMVSHLETEKPPFAVAMLDIDYFKTINDNHGHQAGDKALQFTAGMLIDALREGDLVGRYGGDEFIAILHDPGQNAFSIMERLRAEVAQRTQLSSDFLSITLSIGIYCVLESEPSDQILQKVDMALYTAKRNGRNRVCVYENE